MENLPDHDPSIGLIGLGYWGKNILRNLVELGTLQLACDMDKGVIEERRKTYQDASFCTSVEDVLKDPGVKAVVIAASAATHHDLVKQALEAGKDVMVEKPLSLTAAEGEELIALAREKDRILMVGHILQYHPAVIRLKKLVRDGELGKIQYIYSNRLNIGKLRTEENILWSFAPHDISTILSLLGEEPVSVRAFGGDYLSKGIFDTTLTTLTFRGGVCGHIFVSWLHPYKEQKLIVVGSSAMVVFDDMSDEKLKLYHHKITWKDGKIPVAAKKDYEVVEIEKGEPLKMELQHFQQCVEDRSTPRTDGGEGLRVLKILEAAEKSLKHPSPDSL